MMFSTSEVIRQALQRLRAKYALSETHSAEDGPTASVRFQNTTTAVHVTVDWVEFRPFIRLIDLTDSGDARVGEDKKSCLRSFDADWLFELRAGPDSPAGLMFKDRTAAAAHRLLSRYSDALDKYAADVLHGDFSITVRIAKAIAERARGI